MEVGRGFGGDRIRQRGTSGRKGLASGREGVGDCESAEGSGARVRGIYELGGEGEGV